MMMSENIQTMRLASAAELNIRKTFDCGQCFRWNETRDGGWCGVAFGHPAKVWQEGNDVFIRSAAPNALWWDYFDLERDYDAAASSFCGGDWLDEAKSFGSGIRILRQEPWEALCSFIISQCNNIPRINGIVERLCSYFGDPVDFEGERYYTFPSAERIALLRLEDLQPLRSGYRAEYILSAAKEVASGKTDLDQLAVADWVSAEKALLAMKGIGKKVADCMLLFGLHHMEAFPVDVWIRRALKEHFPPEFDPSALGENAGLAQQYIFYYARSGASGR
jgi:N-glycosylase/DNA lyase